MAELVNLRLHRKRKRRAEKEDEAAQNRISHGRAAAEKSVTSILNARERRRHEAGRLEPPDGDDRQ